jgi:minor histocompatibility antigen H13
MVSVATGLDVPIKLEWPKSVDFSSRAGFTILGLGDIVIPGAFVTMSLRYDLARSLKRDWRVPFAKPYFYSSIVAYVAGLGTTIFVMHTFKAAQPALLYLRCGYLWWLSFSHLTPVYSPACVIAFFITASAKGELQAALQWQDEPPIVPAESEFDELKPKGMEESVSQTDSISLPTSTTNDDFVDIEKETDGVYGTEPENAPKRRKGKKKKN